MPVLTLNKYSFLYNRNVLSPQQMSTQAIIENGFNVYTAFHEIAQLNLAKRLYGMGYSPYLEYRIWGVGEVDIVAMNMAWEVKPITKSGLKQLQKYLDGGGLLPGHEFSPITGIPVFGKFRMGILSSGLEPGVAHYFFYYYDEQGALCTVPSTEVKKAVAGKVIPATVAVGAILALTFVEDVLTAGVGVADDPASIAAALGLGSYILSMP